MSTSTWRRPRTQTLLFSLLIAVISVIIAAGCGDDDSSSDDSGSSSKADTSTSSDESEDTEETTDGGGSGSAAEGFCDDGSATAKGEELDEIVAKRNDAYDSAPSEKLAAPTKVVMKTDKGSFTIDVDPKLAPLAAANFVGLAEDCYYDGTRFHRIIKDFMVQGGDPTGTGSGGPGYQLQDDVVHGDYDRGVVAMANAGPDTGGSQFFIVHGDAVQLPPDYVIFGKVDEKGMAVVDKIAGVDVSTTPEGEPSLPDEPVRVISARVA